MIMPENIVDQNLDELFVKLFEKKLRAAELSGFALNLGCAKGGLGAAFSRRYPNCLVHGVDGDAETLHYQGSLVNAGSDLETQVRMLHGLLPQAAITPNKYDVVISKGLLGKMRDPMTLWRGAMGAGAAGAMVMVMDYLKAKSPEESAKLAALLDKDAPESLRLEFESGVEPEAVVAQLAEAGCPLRVELMDACLVVAYGRLT